MIPRITLLAGSIPILKRLHVLFRFLYIHVRKSESQDWLFSGPSEVLKIVSCLKIA